MTEDPVAKKHGLRLRPKPRSRALDLALEAVEAFGNEALTIMPAQPDTYMLAAGARAAGISMESAERVYLAMVRVAHTG